MEAAQQRVEELRRHITELTATKRLLLSQSKKLGSASDTELLRTQLATLVSRLKSQLDAGAGKSDDATRLVLDNAPEPAKGRLLTDVRYLEQQRAAIAAEYAGIVRGIATKEAAFEPRAARGALQEAAAPAGPAQREMEDWAGSAQQQVVQQQTRQTDAVALQVRQLAQDVHERDRDILHLVSTAVETRAVAVDVAAMIDSQGVQVQTVSQNTGAVLDNLERANVQIATAHARDRQLRMDCLGWVLVGLGVAAGLVVAVLLQP